jgi:hypothetical protein
MLEPLAKFIDVKGIWKLAGLPDPPKLLCHVGVLGWHCHNTTLHPWDPKSLVPQDSTPPMPATASCVVCPKGWKGPKGSMLELALDLPAWAKSKGEKLPSGMWDGTKLQQLAASAVAVASSGAATAPLAARASRV